MLGCYDFCGHYDWIFNWLKEQGGTELLYQYWDEAIYGDSQQHAAELIGSKGLSGMKEYWGHTLEEEAPAGGYAAGIVGDRFWMEMNDCPSRGFLMRNGIEFSRDYCDHCLGWIGPMMKKAGFTVNHAHNHCGQCYWEFMTLQNSGEPEPSIESLKQRLLREWDGEKMETDRFEQANDVCKKRVNTQGQ